MIKPHKGGPAYPTTVHNTNDEPLRVAGETVDPACALQFCGISKQEFFAAQAPVDFDLVARVWGDPDVNLHDEQTRAAFFGVWAMLRVEYANAMLEETAK